MDAGDGDKNGIKLFFELIMELGWLFEITELANASHAKKLKFQQAYGNYQTWCYFKNTTALTTICLYSTKFPAESIMANEIWRKKKGFETLSLHSIPAQQGLVQESLFCVYILH